MTADWPDVSYRHWNATCDTLHAHTQVLGKLAAKLAPPEPQLQHAALRLTARGWETAPLPAPDGSGSLVVLLDLHAHEAVAEHSDGRSARVGLAADRPVGHVTRALIAAVRDLAGAVPFDPAPQEVPWSVPLDEDTEHASYDPDQVSAYFAAATRAAAVLAAVDRVAGPVQINPRPQEVPWSVPLDEDYEHARYDPAAVGDYFAAATQAALALAAFRAPYRGRSSPVNAWWGTFDLAVFLFSGQSADPHSDDFIMRNADAQLVEVGWWPGDARYPKAAFFAFAYPAPPGFADASLSPAAARWDETLGEYILDWDDVRTAADPRGAALQFAQSAFHHACLVCGWDTELAASAESRPPPVR